MPQIKAILAQPTSDGIQPQLTLLDTHMLPDHDVTIRVAYSALNYKDAMSAFGLPGISKTYPHVPGIDAAGVVVSDRSGTFKEGDRVLVSGFDLGMNTFGGLAEQIKVPASWPIKLPEQISCRQAAMIGTAGLTAGYAISSFLDAGLNSNQQRVLITGATGGVSSIATMILAHIGIKPVVVTSKIDQLNYLKAIGADEVLPPEALLSLQKRKLGSEEWFAVLDTVGGELLVNALKQVQFGGIVCSCGIAMSSEVQTSLFPFILRGIRLQGIASADAPRAHREQLFALFAQQWNISAVLEKHINEVDLSQAIDVMKKMLEGKVVGRTLVSINP